jgi:hypothetical protein
LGAEIGAEKLILLITHTPNLLQKVSILRKKHKTQMRKGTNPHMGQQTFIRSNQSKQIKTQKISKLRSNENE